MKVFELARTCGMNPDVVYRTLRAHPPLFTWVNGFDRIEAWTLRPEAPHGG